ncbi:MAG: SpoIIE family protein phosphatase [Armatimonadota bacterium]
MGSAIKPRSIRGKLILVFLIAVGPVLCIQICERVEAYLIAEEVSARHQMDLACVTARAMSAHIARLREQHDALCKRIVLNNSKHAVTVLNKMGSVFGAGTHMWFTMTDTVGPPLKPGTAAQTSLSEQSAPKHGNNMSLLLDTTVRFLDGKVGKINTEIDNNALTDHMPDPKSAYAWHLCGLVGSGGSVFTSKSIKNVSHDGLKPLLQAIRAEDASNIAINCPLCKEKCVGRAVAVRGTNWKIVVLETVRGPVEPLLPQEIWLGGSALASAMGLFIIFMMGNRLARPVIRLSHAATAMAAGDFRKRVNITTEDELQNLGASFNSLAMSLTLHEMTLKRQAMMLAGMVEATRVASSSLEIKKCGRAIARAVCEHLEAADAVVFRKNSVDGGLKILGTHGQRHNSAWKRLASHAADSGGYLVMTEQVSNGEPDKESVLVGVPLSSGSDVIGAIVARFEGGTRRNDLKLGSMRADLLVTFGIHAAAAIGNAEVHSQTEKYSEVLEDWVEHLSSVMEVTNAISPSLNLNETLHALAKATSAAVGTDECAIHIPDRDGMLTVRSCCHEKDIGISTFKIRPGEAVTGKAYSQRCHATCHDASRSLDPQIRRLAKTSGLQSMLSAPLIVENQALGTITVYNKEMHQFSPSEIRLLTSIALHAAVIIRNASLYTRESSIAEMLQNSLVSEAPESCRGLSFASRYIPALDEARIGGDFYDVSILPEGKVGVVIADVSGKGLTAAIHLATCKHMLKAMMFAHPNDPAHALSQLNRAINHFFDLSFFVTVFCGIIDPERETMAYANAGHPPALLISQEGKMQNRLASTGVPVGAGLECDYDMVRVRFGTSDKLLLYTDGVTDAKLDGQSLGVDGIQKIVFEAGPCSPLEMIDRICNIIQDKANSANKDDIAMLAIAHGLVCRREEKLGGIREQRYSLPAQAI